MKETLEAQRSTAQLREQYELEKELAARLRAAPQRDRKYLYGSLYNELYSRISHHPRITRKSNPDAQMQAVRGQMKLLKTFLKKNTTFLEIGAGDCSLSKAVASITNTVIAIDVSSEATKGITLPENLRVCLSDGVSIPVPPESINIAYSHQLMEHLHPDDACEQLQNLYRALAPGGHYICITPNGLSGPHDVSKYFDVVSTGFHLREYTTSELANLFRKVGFKKIQACVGLKGVYVRLPVFSIRVLELFLLVLPTRISKGLARLFPFDRLLGIILVGTK